MEAAHLYLEQDPYERLSAPSWAKELVTCACIAHTGLLTICLVRFRFTLQFLGGSSAAPAAEAEAAASPSEAKSGSRSAATPSGSRMRSACFLFCSLLTLMSVHLQA